MGRDEMLTITSDKWDEEIWGVATPSKFEKPVAKLYFYFGAEDRWVTIISLHKKHEKCLIAS